MSKKDIDEAEKAEAKALEAVEKAQAKYAEAQANTAEVQAANVLKPSTGGMYNGVFVKNADELKKARG